MVKIALAQINPCVGALESNADKIITNIEKAREQKADIVVFPELALTGYPPEDLLLKPHFIERNLEYLDIVAKKTAGLTTLVGFVDKVNGKIYNSCALIQDKKIKDKYHKLILPNYGVFDEKRYFSQGNTFPLYTLDGHNFSLSICEDIWNDNFISALKGKSFDFLINISASPFHLGKIALRKKILSRAAKTLNTYLFYCNLVGGQDELVFDGTSKVFSSDGRLMKMAKMFEEDLLFFDFGKKVNCSSIVIALKEEEEAYGALKLGLADYVKKNGFEKVIVGVSGGIDSAVVVSLAAAALGKANVFALIMPSRYTSKETFSDAQRICRNLEINYHIVNIEGIFESYLSTLEPFFKDKNRDVTEENLQARIRGNILMAFSNKFGYLVINTGNKSEVSCGYCTLYGDMVGGFGILKDVTKLMVYKVAKYINQAAQQEIIPQSIIERVPTAELRYDQKDSDTLPAYDILDPILKLYVEDDCSMDEIVEKGFNRDIVKRVIKMVDLNEYKRRQSPIGIKITPRAFGKDRRMPITNKFSV